MCAALSAALAAGAGDPVPLWAVLWALRPARNLLSRHQLMNVSFDPLHLGNT